MLIPLHGSLPLRQVELSRESPEARTTRQREELIDRGRALTENHEGLIAAEQLAALEALRRQGLELQLEERDRENLDEALASALRRAILSAEQAKDSARARLLREAAVAWGIDLSENSLWGEQRLLEAEKAQRRAGD